MREPKDIRVLVACEESQRVCTAFQARGFEAYSCDIVPCSGGHPEWHIQADALQIINGRCRFETADGQRHEIAERWDLIIAHPPCTYLTVTGNRWFDTGKYGKAAWERMTERNRAIAFFYCFMIADCDRIAIENPIGIMSTAYRTPDCIYNPYDFEGETECKKTCLWLKGLPPLKPTRVFPLCKEERTHGIYNARFEGKSYSWGDHETSRLRSQTPHGVATAMAEQWGNFLKEVLS